MENNNIEVNQYMSEVRQLKNFVLSHKHKPIMFFMAVRFLLQLDGNDLTKALKKLPDYFEDKSKRTGTELYKALISIPKGRKICKSYSIMNWEDVIYATFKARLKTL